MTDKLLDQTEAIERNLSNISVGVIYKNKSDLYKVLGLEKPSGGRNAKLLENEIKQYLDFEKFDESSRSIIIKEVYPIKRPKIDNRINNGGAHNQKYIQFVTPLIIGEVSWNMNIEKEDSYITYLQIYENAYQIPKCICEIINPVNDKIYDFSKAEQRYMNILNNKLYEITNAALESLQREGIISYKKIEVVNDGNDMGILSVLHLFKNEEWLMSVKLVDFLHMIGRFQETNIISIQELIERKTENTSINDISLFEFARLYSKSYLSRNDEKEIREGYRKIMTNESMEVPIKSTFSLRILKYRAADDSEMELIKALEKAIAHYMGYDIGTVMFDMRRRKEFYAIRNAVLRIIGWSPIYKRLYIEILDYGKLKNIKDDGNNAYNLKKELEVFIREKIENTKFNPSKDIKRKGRSFGQQINTREDKDYYWLDTEAVWQLHKEIFRDVLNDKNEND